MAQETRRLLAIDMGQKTLGLALYTPVADLVTPLGTLRRGVWADDVAALRKITDEYTVEAFVIGYPLETDGAEGKRCQSVRAFVRNLERAGFDQEVIYQDERYSTAIAEEVMIGMDASRLKRRAVGDSLAAQVIMERYLERYQEQ